MSLINMLILYFVVSACCETQLALLQLRVVEAENSSKDRSDSTSEKGTAPPGLLRASSGASSQLLGIRKNKKIRGSAAVTWRANTVQNALVGVCCLLCRSLLGIASEGRGGDAATARVDLRRSPSD